MIWKTSTWTPLYGVYLWMSHFKLQFILVEIKWKIHDLPRINSWSLWNSYSKWLKSWLRIRQKLVVWPRLTTSSQCGKQRLYNVTKWLRLRMPKPTTCQSQCCVWVVSVTDQSKHGKTKLNGIWKLGISKIWIASTVSRWSSSGNFLGFTAYPRWDSKDDDWIKVWTWAIQR